MTGRPTNRTEAKVDTVIALLTDGESLRHACKEAGVSDSTFLGWKDADEELSERYARARAIGADLEFDRLDELCEETPPLDHNGKIDQGWVALQKLKIDTKKWKLAKKRPERYGDRIDVTSNGNTVGLAINIDLGEKA